MGRISTAELKLAEARAVITTNELDPETQRLLAEAAELTGAPAKAVLQTALRELIERRRFQRWVASQDDIGGHS